MGIKSNKFPSIVDISCVLLYDEIKNADVAPNELLTKDTDIRELLKEVDAANNEENSCHEEDDDEEEEISSQEDGNEDSSREESQSLLQEDENLLEEDQMISGETDADDDDNDVEDNDEGNANEDSQKSPFQRAKSNDDVEFEQPNQLSIDEALLKSNVFFRTHQQVLKERFIVTVNATCPNEKDMKVKVHNFPMFNNLSPHGYIQILLKEGGTSDAYALGIILFFSFY